MTLQTLTRLSRCSQTLSISFFGSNPHFLSSFFTLNILFILLCLLFPFARRKTIYCLQCLYIWKKKNHNAPFSHLISPFLTSNVINTLLFFLSWNRNSQMLEHLSNVSECMFDSHLQRKERRGHISENWPSQIFLILHFKYHNEVFEPI